MSLPVRDGAFQLVHQPLVRVPPEHFERPSHKVGQRVDVVEAGGAVAIVDHQLDPADVELGGLGNLLGGRDDVGRRGHGAHGNGGAAGLGQASVGGAEIEAVGAALHLQRVEEAAAQCLDAGDRAAAGGHVILEQQHLVHAVGDGAVGRRIAPAPRAKRSG
jgi:hypothetical protein